MAKVDSSGYRKERGAAGGGGNLPKFIKHTEPMIGVCLALNYIRAKTSGRWGVAALMMAVDGPDAGAVINHKMWTEKSIFQFIVNGYGYEAPFENGLPDDRGRFSPNSEAHPDNLSEMLTIVTCGDQSEVKDRKKVWLPGIPASARRSPYVKLTLEPDGDSDKYLRVKWVDRTPERGADGPYFIGNRRDVLGDRAAIDLAKNWFDGNCEKAVREANEAAQKRAREDGDGDGGGHHNDNGYDDSEIPF